MLNLLWVWLLVNRRPIAAQRGCAVQCRGIGGGCSRMVRQKRALVMWQAIRHGCLCTGSQALWGRPAVRAPRRSAAAAARAAAPSSGWACPLSWTACWLRESYSSNAWPESSRRTPES